MKALILKIFVIVILVVSFSSFVFIKKSKDNQRNPEDTTMNYQYEFQDGMEDRELR
jgi:hypothetical protein